MRSSSCTNKRVITIFAAAAGIARARVSFVDPITGEVIPGSVSWESQKFVFYSSRSPKTVTGPGITAAGVTYQEDGRCKLAKKGSPAYDALRGKIFFHSIWGDEDPPLECQAEDWEEYFLHLKGAGILAYVSFDPYSPPGADCFGHCKPTTTTTSPKRPPLHFVPFLVIS